jgi:hypothetical protein
MRLRQSRPKAKKNPYLLAAVWVKAIPITIGRAGMSLPDGRQVQPAKEFLVTFFDKKVTRKREFVLLLN